MKRHLTALIVLPILIASILVSYLWWVFVLLAVAAVVLGLWEFYLLATRLQLKPDVAAGYLAAAILVTISLQNNAALNLLLAHFVVLVLTAGVLISATLRGAPFDKMIASAGATILGVLYIPLLGSHLLSLRMSFDQTLSAHLLSFFFLVLMGADAGAYYIGSAFGKHKLAPSISPGKTWEGAAGGVLAALALGALAHFWFFRELPLKYIMPLAALMTVLGIFGDLAESALKRSAGAKDAANILPGHGGMLDRLDSLLFNAPLIYYFALFYFKADR
jgi:phosphatidate cytidylyltransferase